MPICFYGFRKCWVIYLGGCADARDEATEIEIKLQQVSANSTDLCLTAINTLPSRTPRRTIGLGNLRPSTHIDTPICNVCRRSSGVNETVSNRSN
jgi:hypothetical protein